jgi:hypothetical protein
MEESLQRVSFKMGFQPSERVASGEVVEWLMALVLKTSDVKASVGSNPTLSVQGIKRGFPRFPMMSQ